MDRSLRLVVITAIAAFLHSFAVADVIWTYQFTPTGTRTYYDSCGECGSYLGTRADIVGTFSILLNGQSGAGKLLQINTQLVNAVDTYLKDGVVVTQPSLDPNFGIVRPWVILVQTPGHVSYEQNGLWRLRPDVSPPFGTPYDIWFTVTAATFSRTVGNIDHYISVSNAFAAFVGITTAGDYNGDARVDARDYVSWRKSAGTENNYNLWRNYFGDISASGTTNGPVPEPSALFLTSLCLYITMCIRGRHWR
jgi:hypothetical protein